MLKEFFFDNLKVPTFDVLTLEVDTLRYSLMTANSFSRIDELKDEWPTGSKHTDVNVFTACGVEVGNSISWIEDGIDVVGYLVLNR